MWCLLCIYICEGWVPKLYLCTCIETHVGQYICCVCIIHMYWNPCGPIYMLCVYIWRLIANVIFMHLYRNPCETIYVLCVYIWRLTAKVIFMRLYRNPYGSIYAVSVLCTETHVGKHMLCLYYAPVYKPIWAKYAVISNHFLTWKTVSLEIIHHLFVGFLGFCPITSHQ